MGRPQKISNQDLLKIAREVFLRHGVFGSTREIAAKAGISEAALFKRFSSKAQLFMSAMAPPTPGIEGILAQAAAARSARQGLRIVAEGLLDYFRIAIPLVLPLVSHPSFAAADLPRNFDTSAATHLTEAVAGFLRDEQKKRRIAAPDPFAAAGMLVAAMHSIALFELMGFHDGAMPREGIDALVDALWHGVKPTSKGSTKK